jgi:hypothetical protein
MIASLTEEAEAIGWHEQRRAVETDQSPAAIMKNRATRGDEAFRNGLRYDRRLPPAILQ